MSLTMAMAQRSTGMIYGWLLMMTCCVMVGSVERFVVDSVAWPPPPPWTEKVKMARYLVNSADWAIVSTVSKEFGYIPFGTLQSFTDGPLRNGTGVPYFYLADVSTTLKNLDYNNTASVTISQAESGYCQKMKWDSMLPLCARITLSGRIKKCTGSEAVMGKAFLFARHPSMKTWPVGHDWNVHKLDISHIFLQDFFGPADIIPVKNYFAGEL